MQDPMSLGQDGLRANNQDGMQIYGNLRTSSNAQSTRVFGEDMRCESHDAARHLDLKKAMSLDLDSSFFSRRT